MAGTARGSGHAAGGRPRRVVRGRGPLWPGGGERTLGAAGGRRRRRTRANEALAEAESSRAEAQRQSLAAEASFALARKAVDDSFTQVSENKLLNVPGLRVLLRDLLGSAMSFYDEFLREHGDDLSLK